MQAKAAIFNGPGKPFTLRTYPLTRPAEGYALCRLIASGVCGTDIHIHRGLLGVGYPAVIGHEFVGSVTEINGPPRGLKAGDSVISCIAVPCRSCALCRSGDDANCVNMRVTNSADPDEPPHFHGGFGEYCCSPTENLVRIPDSLDPKAACVFACAGPTALHGFSLAQKAGFDVRDAETAVVQGLGPVGLFALMYLIRSCVNRKNIIAISSGADQKRAELAESLGARVLSLREDGEELVTKKILTLTGGLGADVAFEASGSPAAFAQGLRFLRNRGLYIVPGQYSNAENVPVPAQLITFKALRVIGSSQYSLPDIRAYLDFMRTNLDFVTTASSISSGYRLDDINAAFADAAAGKNIKTLLVP